MTELNTSYKQTMAELAIDKICQKLFWYDNLPDADYVLGLVKAWRERRAELKALGIDNEYTANMAPHAALSDDGWTYCDDRLPEDSGEYLITDGFGAVLTLLFSHDKKRWACSHSIDVLAWRRKPEPAKGRDI